MIQSVKDLWIGDELLLKKSKRKGKYEGTNDEGKLIIVLHNGKKVITTLRNVEPYIPPKRKIKLEFNDDKSIASPTGNEIDLHIDQLAPHLIGQPSPRIIDVQIEAFEAFINASYQARKMTVVVIHGKGTGVLKEEIRYRCRGDNRIKLLVDLNQGGATEIWFEYHR